MVLLKGIGVAVGILVGLVLVAVIALYFYTSGEYRVADTVLTDPDLPRAEIGGLTLHAETFGDPGNTPLIVLHGGPGGDYRSLMGLQALADSFYVIFYDQRGAGLSERVPAEQLTVDTYLEELDNVIAHFAGARPVILVGHSWGAMLGAAYLGHAPEKVQRAVLMEPGFFNAAEMAEWNAQGSQYLSGLNYVWTALLTGFEAQHVSGPDDNASNDYLIGTIVHYFANHPDNPYHCPGEAYDAPSWRFGATANSAASTTPPEEIDRIELGTGYEGPVLMLASICNDWIGPDLQKRHADMFTNARLKIISDSGHEMVWDNPDETLAAIRQFLSE